MKNAALKYITLIMISAITTSASPRGFLPKIEQLRNKVETVIHNTPQTNIKKLLDEARVEKDAQGIIHKIIELAPTQTTDVQSCEQELKQIYWGNNGNLVKLLNEKKSAPKKERLEILHKELMQKYPNNPQALFTFAGDLVNEDTALQDIIQRIFKKISDEKNTTARAKLNELLNTATKLKANIKELTNAANAIIME